MSVLLQIDPIHISIGEQIRESAICPAATP